MHKRLLCAAAFLALMVPATGHAEAVASSFGPRVGLSVNPDQIVLGGQMVVGELAPDITFSPNVEFGFGDHVTVIALNLDGQYHFRIQNSAWRPYLGFGLGVNFWEFDAPPGFRDNSDTEVGGNLIVGAGVPTRSNNRFFTEARFGLGDIPDLKIMVGWLFAM
jgi:hypothetical protein